MFSVRLVDLPRDREPIRRLWGDYLTWVDRELDARYGLRLPVLDTVEHDLATIAKFLPPDGRTVLASGDKGVFGIASMRRITRDTREIKRMYVDPSHRRSGVAGAMLDRLIEEGTAVGYGRIRLDSPDFATAAHALYRARGFSQIGPYAESEIPEEHRSHAIFMEKDLR